MDLFGAGSFTGKGIYDVDAFEAATGQTFPENQILSHDLIEGNYARCGLVTDIELFDDFPARYHAYARREHRWVRGDWQLLPWLGPDRADGRRAEAEPAAAARAVEDLRQPAAEPRAAVGRAAAGARLDGPARLGLALDGRWRWRCRPCRWSSRHRRGARRRSGADAVGPFLGALATTCRRRPAQALLTIAFLADQARLLRRRDGADALPAVRHAGRHMLEWETAAATERRLGTGPGQFFQTMWPAPALADRGRGVWWRGSTPTALLAAAPVLAAWSLSPVGRLLGQPAAATWPTSR